MMTVEELDNLCVILLEKVAYEDKAKKRMDEIKADTKAAETAVLEALESLDKTENEGSFGKVKITQREYYKMIDKEKAMAWLKERGEFEHLVTVNANTFSSHVKKLVHEKRDEGDFIWTPPGVEDSTSDYKKVKIIK